MVIARPFFLHLSTEGMSVLLAGPLTTELSHRNPCAALLQILHVDDPGITPHVDYG